MYLEFLDCRVLGLVFITVVCDWVFDGMFADLIVGVVAFDWLIFPCCLHWVCDVRLNSYL